MQPPPHAKHPVSGRIPTPNIPLDEHAKDMQSLIGYDLRGRLFCKLGQWAPVLDVELTILPMNELSGTPCARSRRGSSTHGDFRRLQIANQAPTRQKVTSRPSLMAKCRVHDTAHTSPVGIDTNFPLGPGALGSSPGETWPGGAFSLSRETAPLTGEQRDWCTLFYGLELGTHR